MKKCFMLLLTLALLMIMGMTVFACADGNTGVTEGDAYDLNPANWPNRHWCYMTANEIAQYEAIGWQRYTGVLWYDDEGKAMDFAEVQTDAIQNLYNKGYSFHVIYHWLCPGEKLGKHQEQSVYVGRWKLSPSQAIEYHNTYVVPELTMVGDSQNSYYSQWYFKNQESKEPEDSDPVEILPYYSYVRHIFETYMLGYGSELYLRTGNYDCYSLDEAIAIGAFDSEIVHWE